MIDGELTSLIDAWPHLRNAIKAAIGTLVGSITVPSGEKAKS
jgi:hypothetical protein